ncbi:MAG: 3-methylornithine--L-lysine ligase PylC, partial [Bacillota bacterium]|nr:3-methylornithine--L-lysine ligase PylC [Bacillota bacterium]
MKTAVIVGGRLQGLETLYLAKKAHIHTTLIDKDEAPIGQNFCNRFIQKDVIQYGKELLPILKTADIVLPALENPGALEVLAELK